MRPFLMIVAAATALGAALPAPRLLPPLPRQGPSARSGPMEGRQPGANQVEKGEVNERGPYRVAVTATWRGRDGLGGHGAK